MKAVLFDSQGNKKGEITLPGIFNTKIREDIVHKYFEADKFIQPYAPNERAGLRQSAAGKISHKRHDWKGHYGKGMSRMPRKTMWRRGTQFYWVGANVPGTRGGRRAHPPRGYLLRKKINKKEIEIALNSVFAATAFKEYALKRYPKIKKIDSLPSIIESLPNKTSALIELLKKIFGENFELAIKNKIVRAGKGKLRGRKYKSNAGALIVVGKEENKKFRGFDIKSLDETKISDLYPLGRLTIFTKKALEELSKEKSA
jgi:large subunit ribosomal protein L4e